MAQARGSFPVLTDNVDKVVFSVADSTQQGLKPIWKRYFRIESSDKKFERRTSYARFTTTPEKAEGADYSTQLMDQGYTKDFTALEFGLGFETTQTMLEDDQYGTIKEYARGLTLAANYTMEQYAARLHNQYTTQTTPDALAAYHTTHLLIKGGTGLNIVNADLSRAALETALILMHTDAKSDEGYFMQPPDGYLLEVPPALHFLADRIVNSTKIQGSADNDKNAFDQYSIDVLVNPHIEDTDSWRVIAKGKQHGMLSYTRIALGMEPPVQLPRSGNRLYKNRFRRSWGWDRYQGVVGSPGA